MLFLFPVWFEEEAHRYEAEMGLGPGRLVAAQLADRLCVGVHPRKALTKWHASLGDEPVGAGQAFAVAGFVVDDEGAGIVLVELFAPVLADFHRRAEVFKGQLPRDGHVVDSHGSSPSLMQRLEFIPS